MGSEGDKENNHTQCPMPNAQCPMPNAQCPMPSAQCPITNDYNRNCWVL
ncbi:MAG: histidine kinase [Nostoc sp.]